MSYEFWEHGENGGIINVSYSVFYSEKYGIKGISCCGNEKTQSNTPAIFFTEEEARMWCCWLTKNKVLPSSLNEILSDELYIY